MILPENLLKDADIKDKALFIGKGPTLEIWNPARFASHAERARDIAKQKRHMLRLSKNNEVADGE